MNSEEVKKKDIQIVELGKKLNTALAVKVGELNQYKFSLFNKFDKSILHFYYNNTLQCPKLTITITNPFNTKKTWMRLKRKYTKNK